MVGLDEGTLKLGGNNCVSIWLGGLWVGFRFMIFKSAKGPEKVLFQRRRCPRRCF